MSLAYFCLNWNLKITVLSISWPVWIINTVSNERKEVKRYWPNGIQNILTGRGHHLPLPMYAPVCDEWCCFSPPQWPTVSLCLLWFHSPCTRGGFHSARCLLIYVFLLCSSLLQHRRPFRSRTTATEAKLIIFLMQWMLISDAYPTYWFIANVTTALQFFPLGCGHSWELLGAC